MLSIKRGCGVVPGPFCFGTHIYLKSPIEKIIFEQTHPNLCQGAKNSLKENATKIQQLNTQIKLKK